MNVSIRPPKQPLDLYNARQYGATIALTASSDMLSLSLIYALCDDIRFKYSANFSAGMGRAKK